MKPAAILSGGDWADASVELLMIPDSLDINAKFSAYRSWYDTEYRPNTRGAKEFLTFAQWLIRHCGARMADETEIVTHGPPD